MADPNFLNREFEIEIPVANVFLRSLRNMKKLADKAALIVTDPGSIQILATNLDANVALDLLSDHIIAPSNSDGYSLWFYLITWILALRTPIFLDPSSSMIVKKSPGSIDVYCLFGVNRELISLGEARFSRIAAVDPTHFPRYLRIQMPSDKFRDFIDPLCTKLEPRIPSVKMLITETIIRCVTPTGHHDHQAREFVMSGVRFGVASYFRMRWNLPLFQMLSSASIDCDTVGLSVMRNPQGQFLYRFWFLNGCLTLARYCFSFIEKEPLQPQNGHV